MRGTVAVLLPVLVASQCDSGLFYRATDQTCHSCPTEIINRAGTSMDLDEFHDDCGLQDDGDACYCQTNQNTFAHNTWYTRTYFEEETMTLKLCPHQMHNFDTKIFQTKVLNGYTYKDIRDCTCVDAYDYRVPMQMNPSTQECDCNPDMYYSFVDHTCHECPADTSVDSGATSVLECSCNAANMVLDEETLSCVCLPDHVHRRTENTCHPCPKAQGCAYDSEYETCACAVGNNTYFDITALAYVKCPRHTAVSYAATSVENCVCTRANQVLDPDVAACVCMPGYVYQATNESCNPCPPLNGCAFSTDLGTCACSATVNKYFDINTLQYVSCPQGTTAKPGSKSLSDCVCNDENTTLHTTSQTCQCRPGFALDPSGEYCVCVEDYVYTGGACEPCPAKHFTVPGDNTCWCKPSAHTHNTCKADSNNATLTTFAVVLRAEMGVVNDKKEEVLAKLRELFGIVRTDLLVVHFAIQSQLGRRLLSDFIVAVAEIYSIAELPNEVSINEIKDAFVEAGLTVEAVSAFVTTKGSVYERRSLDGDNTEQDADVGGASGDATTEDPTGSGPGPLTALLIAGIVVVAVACVGGGLYLRHRNTPSRSTGPFGEYHVVPVVLPPGYTSLPAV